MLLEKAGRLEIFLTASVDACRARFQTATDETGAIAAGRKVTTLGAARLEDLSC